MELAHAQGAYGAAYLGALVSAPEPEPLSQILELTLADVPGQAEIDRALSVYEVFVWTPDGISPYVGDGLVPVAAGVHA